MGCEPLGEGQILIEFLEWCGMVRYGMVWYGIDIIWYDYTACAWDGMIMYGYGMVQYGLAWYSTI